MSIGVQWPQWPYPPVIGTNHTEPITISGTMRVIRPIGEMDESDFWDRIREIIREELRSDEE